MWGAERGGRITRRARRKTWSFPQEVAFFGNRRGLVASLGGQNIDFLVGTVVGLEEHENVKFVAVYYDHAEAIMLVEPRTISSDQFSTASR